MPISPPPPFDPAPTPGPVRGQKATFSQRLDDLVTWWQNSPAQLVALCANVWNNAVEAYNRAVEAAQSAADAASAARAAASASSATKWVSGAVYADGDSVWSPMDRYPYRRVGAGSGTIDPKLDPGNWVVQLFAVGLGGQTITSSISLAASSPGAITVTPSSPGQYAILPDATTCTKGASLYSIFNAGDSDYGIKDAGGGQLGWIRPGTGIQIGLAANGTLSGTWIVSGTAKIGITASLSSTAISSDSNLFSRVALDATRSFFLFGNVYGVVYDAATGQWGAPVLIRSGAGTVLAAAVLSASNQVLVVTILGAAYEAVTISASGVSLTVNSGSKATVTLPSAAVSSVALRATASGFAHLYLTTGTVLRGISVSGNSPVIGNAMQRNGTRPVSLFVSANVARLVIKDSGNVICEPYTMSGSATPVAGTSASAASNTDTAYRASMNGNGNIVVVHRSSSTNFPIAAVFKLTGTVEAASAVTFGGPMVGATQDISDFIQVSSGKTVFVFAGNDAVRIEILTDTAGAASAGTPISFAMPGAAQPAALVLSGTTARFSVSATAANYQVAIDCSTASPSLLGVHAVHKSISGPGTTLQDGQRNYRRLEVGATAYSTCSPGDVSGDGHFTPSGVRPLSSVAAAFQAGVPGTAANDTWGLEQLGATGCTIKRLEACA